MRERLIGDWLAKANERSFQVPFCWWLVSLGYRVLHLTRHSAMELGKDIIAIAPDGVPCVYQLKGTETRITMSVWRSELQGQLHDAAYSKPVHPSLPDDAPHHRIYLVTNGSLDEEVSSIIDNTNRQLEKDGRAEKKIHTIAGLEIAAGLVQMGEGFWPTDLVDTKAYLELYLAPGEGRLNKERLADLLASTLDLDRQKAPGQRGAAQAITGAALVCAAATAPFTRASNWIAEFETWTVFLASILCFAEQQDVAEKVWLPWANHASDLVLERLAFIVDDVRSNESLIFGHPIVEKLSRNARLVEILGLVSLFSLWASKEEADRLAFSDQWLRKNIEHLSLPGEYAAPLFFIASAWFRKSSGTPDPDFMLLRAIDTILVRNGRTPTRQLLNPYYDADQVLMAESGNDVPDESFKGSSFALESFIYVFARRLWKSPLVMRWEEVTYVDRSEFVPHSKADWLRWRRPEGGEYTTRPWNQPQDWSELLLDARRDDVTRLPKNLMRNLFWYLSFVCVYPHRFTSDGARWADTKL